MMREVAKKNVGVFFSSLTKFYKRWSTIMIMLVSSEGGGGRWGRNLLRGPKLGSPPPSCATDTE